jgi:hypothetical protein
VLPRSREHKNDETRSREALSEWNRSMDVARLPASAPTEFRSGVLLAHSGSCEAGRKHEWHALG